MLAFIKKFKHIRQVLSVVLALCLIFVLSACNDSDKDNDNSQVSSVNSSNTGSDTSDKSDTSEVNVIGQKFNVTENIALPRSDYDEKRPSNVTPNMYAPLKGFKDAEAEKLKNKILNSENTEKLYKIEGTKYYISPAGSDDNDGKSPENAFRTVDALSSMTLKSGDAVLFERGSIFRTVAPIFVVSGVTYGSYGKGSKPQIYASAYNYADGDYWEPTKVENIWKATYVYERISCAVFDFGEIIGKQRQYPIDLKENGDFYSDETSESVYIYCDKGNPSRAFESIEFSPGRCIFVADGGENFVIDNLSLKYTGNAGVLTRGDNKNISITNCEMAYIGGFAYRIDGTRLGNAVEIEHGCDNLVVENNWIYQTFDTAISWQTDGTNYSNVSFSGNLLEYNTVDIEFFSSDGCRVKNFKMDGNIMRFTSGGWGNRIDDAGIRGIEGCVRAVTYNLNISDIYFTNNIIDSPVHRIFDWHNNPSQNKEIKFGGNQYFIKKSNRITDSVMFKFTVNEKEYGNYGEVDFNVTNSNEFKNAISRIDSSMKFEWFD